VFRIECFGDAFMIASGCPDSCADHASRIVDLALDMLENIDLMRSLTGLPGLNLRIGIHSGPIVGVVSGVNDPRYHLFGETARMASRIESHAEPGKVQISGATMTLIADRYLCEEVNSRHKSATYFVRGRRESRVSNTKQEVQTKLQTRKSSLRQHVQDRFALIELLVPSSLTQLKLNAAGRLHNVQLRGKFVTVHKDQAERDSPHIVTLDTLFQHLNKEERGWSTVRNTEVPNEPSTPSRHSSHSFDVSRASPRPNNYKPSSRGPSPNFNRDRSRPTLPDIE